MDYKDALDRLLGLVDFERYVAPRGTRTKFNLNRMNQLLESLDNPHLNVPSVHIAGTKGKGSTTALVAAALRHQGYSTGMFISPHLHSFRERINVNGEPISEKAFSSLVTEIWPHTEKINEHTQLGQATLFETLTAMAFLHFSRIGLDFQVVETGLGGRLDSTNLIRPIVSGITSISLDHMAILGDSVEQIASEKAGIIKPSVPVVLAPQSEEGVKQVIQAVCLDINAPFIEVGHDIKWQKTKSTMDGQSFVIRGRLGTYDLEMPLLGDYQLENAASAIGILEVITESNWAISQSAIRKGFFNVSWPCRMEVLKKEPLIVADGAHNPHSIERLSTTLADYFGRRRVILIFGASADKNLSDMIDAVMSLDPLVIVTRSRHPRSMEPFRLAEKLRKKGLNTVRVHTVGEAIRLAEDMASEDDIVLATGSLFVAAEAREAILNVQPELYFD